MKLIFLILISLFGNLALPKIPDWAKLNSTKIEGEKITIACQGKGPSLRIARSEAIKNCELEAIQFLEKTINFKSLTIETEKSVGIHQEITSDNIITGLKCIPIKDEFFEENSITHYWLLCSFALNNTEIHSNNSVNFNPSVSSASNLEYVNFPKTEDIRNNIFFISTVPKCESILVIGKHSKNIICNKNPVKVVLEDKDSQIVIRLTGYKSKTINLKGNRNNETIQILLDRM